MTIVKDGLVLWKDKPVTISDTSSGEVLPFPAPTGIAVGMAANGTNIVAGATVTALAPTSITLSKPVAGDVPSGTIISFTSSATLGAVIAQRRGPIGSLAASCANLEVPLPLIDIVNECLEFLGAAATPTNGAVYDTSAKFVAGHALCREDCPAEHDGCHEPIALLAALPEHATPAMPTAANAAVEPAVYNKLKGDFSSCHLPYSQAIDVSRTYLRHFGGSRFDAMRIFRKCITEFVLDPVNGPPEFNPTCGAIRCASIPRSNILAGTPEEYELLFKGPQPKPCGAPVDGRHRQPPSCLLGSSMASRRRLSGPSPGRSQLSGFRSSSRAPASAIANSSSCGNANTCRSQRRRSG